MSRASIFDLLHERDPVVEPVSHTPQIRNDYAPDRLRVIDGVALSPAGFIAQGSLPEPHTPELSDGLIGADGFRLLIHEIVDLPTINERQLARIDPKALRLHQLIQSIIIEALLLLEGMPEGEGFDVVLSAPVRTPRAGE